MDWLEQELNKALERKEPRKVSKRGCAGGWGGPSGAGGMMPRRRWLAAATVVIVLAGTGEAYRWHRGQDANEQVMTAMRITGDKLNRVQVQIAGERQ